MVQKFIALVGGRLKEVLLESIAATSGAADADKLVRTGGDGKLDPTLLPVGIGADALSLTASENLAGGDFVNVHIGGVRKADGSASGKEADGFVLDAVSSGQPVTVYFEGRNTALSGLTVGARYYLSATTPGAATSTPPSSAGNVVQYLGRASEATSISFEATDGVILA